MELTSGQINRLRFCLKLRSGLMDGEHQTALRIFNGFYEGFNGVAVDIYGKTLVLDFHFKKQEAVLQWAELLTDFYKQELPWIESVLVKARNMDEAYKKGKLSYGKGLQDKIRENNVWYALQLDLNQDSSFYLDTRNLRKWLAEHMQDKKVLNCFAYTGTLGIAALSGGAAHVIQTDINPRFLDIAKKSAKLNAIPDSKTALVTSDFFKFVSRLKTSRTLFDCVILDPPFFSTNAFGAIDMEKEFLRVINKARPLIAHEGWMVVINNALYLSGAQMMRALEELCDGTYLRIQETIPVPDDICGYPKSITTPAPVDPKPFNHPTKIMILKVKRKDKQAAS